jgi:hypothetical protein
LLDCSRLRLGRTHAKNKAAWPRQARRVKGQQSTVSKACQTCGSHVEEQFEGSNFEDRRNLEAMAISDQRVAISEGARRRRRTCARLMGLHGGRRV